MNKCTYRPGANIIIKISFNVIAHPQKLINRAESNEFLRYMKFLKRFVFVSNDYETDVYVNHNRDITSETAKVRVQLHNMLTVRVQYSYEYDITRP